MKITDVETAMKAKEIVKRAFPLDRRNTRYVAPVKLERAPKGFKVVTVTKIPGQRARQQIFRCNMSPGYNGYFNDCPDVQCDCSCGRYKFVWNYALNQRGAAIKDRTNGEAPIVTNPGEIPGICIDGESWIYTEFGSKRLKNIEIGERVRTLYGLRRVTEKVDKGIKPTVCVETDSTKNFNCTLSHRILALSEKGVRWVKAKNLTKNHYLVISSHDTKTHWPRLDGELPKKVGPRTIEPLRVPTKLTPDVAEFLGIVVAEGSGTDKISSVSQEEPITLARIIHLCRKLWNRPTLRPMSLGIQVSKILRRWGIVFGSYEIGIPDCVLEASNDILADFLRGYYAGDGWFSKNGRCSTAGTASKKLRDDLVYALGRLGIGARSTENRSGHNKILMHLVRTSSSLDTEKASNLFLPERCEIENDNYKLNNGTISTRIPIDTVRRELHNLSLICARSAKGNDDLVPVTDLLQAFHGYNLWNSLKKENLIAKLHRAYEGGGGKLQHFATLNAALFATEKIRAKKIFNTYFKIGTEWKSIRKDKIQKMLKTLPAKYRRLIPTSLSLLVRDDIRFEKVRSVTPNKSLHVFDIGVEDTPHFFANGFCVHNCKHGVLALRLLSTTNPYWMSIKAKENTGKAIRLTNLDATLKRIRRNRI